MTPDTDTTDDDADVGRLQERLDDYRAAVETVATGADAPDESYEAAAADVLALEARLLALSSSVPRAARRDLLAEFDDLGYVRDLLALPRRPRRGRR
jgi:hypothetical protein